MSVYITKRFVKVNTEGADSPEALVKEFSHAVSILTDMAQKESLEPVWSDAKIGEAPEDAMLHIFDNPSGTYITVPMVGDRQK